MMILLGYALTALNYLLRCVGRFMYHKKDMLLIDLLAEILTICALYCLGSISGTLSFAVEFLVLIAANIKERLHAKWTLLYILFQILYTLIPIYTYQGVSSILVFVTASIALCSTWWLVPQKMRLLGCFNCTVFLIYQISIKNWAGLLEIFIVLSNFISYLKYRHRK
ncbi:MAG: YgjV family protein [Alphaproteobacteria bacterium]|nr:YgjV family protein [Alphaproteobacteria bacterium]